MRSKCPNCEKLMIAPVGPNTAKLVLVGTFPGQQEIMRGIPFCGPSGDILRSELARAGIPIGNCRITNLWQHAKDEKGCDVKWHVNQMAKEIAGREFALLMGHDIAKALFDCGIMEISGLEMSHELFPKVRIFMSPNPADLIREPVGEFRLALNRLTEAMNG